MDLSINEGTLVVTGGPGDTIDTAIVVKKTPRGMTAAAAEYLFLSRRFGIRDQTWRLERQDLITKDGRTFDTFQIRLADGSSRELFFDVTDWLARVQQV
jgi:hypothetical protein